MIRKGNVSDANNIAKIARVVFPDMDNNVTFELPIAQHVGELTSGDVVLVAFWSGTDGAVIAEMG